MRGLTVTLYERTASGLNEFGEQTFTETAVDVPNVLIGEPTTDDITSSTQLYGKQIKYMLGIPKGDTHNWEDARVEWTDSYAVDHVVHTFGIPITGVEANIPGPWHMKVRCEDYGRVGEV